MTTDERTYVQSVMAAYAAVADPPAKPRPFDRAFALALCRESIPISIVLAAITLAFARRTRRPLSVPPLPKIRSLAYFRPVIDELIADPPQPGYLAYLTRTTGSCPDSRGLR